MKKYFYKSIRWIALSPYILDAYKISKMIRQVSHHKIFIYLFYYCYLLTLKLYTKYECHLWIR